MNKTPIIAAALGAAILTSALAGCTGTTDNSHKTPAPTSSAHGTKTPGADYDAKSAKRATDEKKWAAQQEEAKHPTGKCLDGTSLITAKDTAFDLPDGCGIVRIIGSGATVSIGSVEHLVVEGKDNTITAKDVKTIDSISIGNSVKYTADKDAKITDKGSDNTFKRIN